MSSHILTALRMTVLMTVLTGLIYPAVVTAIAQVVFPRQAHGSLVTVRGTIVGSALIGQPFTKAEYLHPRPSAAGAGYDGSLSGGSNLGPTNAKLIARIRSAVVAYRTENEYPAGPIPADAVTTSASGLDPHISPANAHIQAGRIAIARDTTRERVEEVIAGATERPWLAFIGEPRVNVLQVNLRLDERFPLIAPVQ